MFNSIIQLLINVLLIMISILSLFLVGTKLSLKPAFSIKTGRAIYKKFVYYNPLLLGLSVFIKSIRYGGLSYRRAASISNVYPEFASEARRQMGYEDINVILRGFLAITGVQQSAIAIWVDTVWRYVEDSLKADPLMSNFVLQTEMPFAKGEPLALFALMQHAQQQRPTNNIGGVISTVPFPLVFGAGVVIVYFHLISVLFQNVIIGGGLEYVSLVQKTIVLLQDHATKFRLFNADMKGGMQQIPTTQKLRNMYAINYMWQFKSIQFDWMYCNSYDIFKKRTISLLKVFYPSLGDMQVERALDIIFGDDQVDRAQNTIARMFGISNQQATAMITFHQLLVQNGANDIGDLFTDDIVFDTFCKFHSVGWKLVNIGFSTFAIKSYLLQDLIQSPEVTADEFIQQTFMLKGDFSPGKIRNNYHYSIPRSSLANPILSQDYALFIGNTTEILSISEPENARYKEEVEKFTVSVSSKRSSAFNNSVTYAVAYLTGHYIEPLRMIQSGTSNLDNWLSITGINPSWGAIQDGLTTVWKRDKTPILGSLSITGLLPRDPSTGPIRNFGGLPGNQENAPNNGAGSGRGNPSAGGTNTASVATAIDAAANTASRASYAGNPTTDANGLLQIRTMIETASQRRESESYDDFVNWLTDLSSRVKSGTLTLPDILQKELDAEITYSINRRDSLDSAQEQMGSPDANENETGASCYNNRSSRSSKSRSLFVGNLRMLPLSNTSKRSSSVSLFAQSKDEQSTSGSRKKLNNDIRNKKRSLAESNQKARLNVDFGSIYKRVKQGDDLNRFVEDILTDSGKRKVRISDRFKSVKYKAGDNELLYHNACTNFSEKYTIVTNCMQFDESMVEKRRSMSNEDKFKYISRRLTTIFTLIETFASFVPYSPIYKAFSITRWSFPSGILSIYDNRSNNIALVDYERGQQFVKTDVVRQIPPSGSQNYQTLYDSIIVRNGQSQKYRIIDVDGVPTYEIIGRNKTYVDEGFRERKSMWVKPRIIFVNESLHTAALAVFIRDGYSIFDLSGVEKYFVAIRAEIILDENSQVVRYEYLYEFVVCVSSHETDANTLKFDCKKFGIS